MEGLTVAQRRELQARLAREQERAQRRIAVHERDFEDLVTASAEAVRDDEHDPEGHTIAFARAQLAAARAELHASEQAQRRLSDPDVDSCRRCGQPIGYERLLARPAATSCIGCART